MTERDRAMLAAGEDEKALMTGMTHILHIIKGLSAANDRLLVVVHAPSQPLLRALGNALPQAASQLQPNSNPPDALLVNPPSAFRGRFTRSQSVSALGEDDMQYQDSLMEELPQELAAVSDYQVRGAGNLANTNSRFPPRACGSELIFGAPCTKASCNFAHDLSEQVKLAFSVSANSEKFLNKHGLSATTGDNAHPPVTDSRPAHLQKNVDRPIVAPPWDMHRQGSAPQTTQTHAGPYQSPSNPTRSLHSLDSTPARVHFQEFSASSYDPFLANERRSLQYCPEEEDSDDA
jgi:hypothetical protein